VTGEHPAYILEEITEVSSDAGRLVVAVLTDRATPPHRFPSLDGDLKPEFRSLADGAQHSQGILGKPGRRVADSPNQMPREVGAACDQFSPHCVLFQTATRSLEGPKPDY